MGGSCSQCCATVVLPSNIAFDQIPTSPTRLTSSQTLRLIENCIVIWLFDDPSRKYENEKEQLRSLVYGFQVFTNPDVCIDYLRDIRDEKVFLITSVTYQSIVNFYHLSSLEKIYIFDPLSLKDQKRKKHANIFSNIANLCKQLQQDIELCEFDLIYFSTISNLSNEISRERTSFIFIQIFNEIVARLKFDSNAKNVFIDFCRLHYSHNDKQLHMINEFTKSYRPHTALDWFQRSCFISKILNRVKRTREIDIIYKLGFFIKQLHVQLVHLHEENESLLKTLSIVYRGKTMLNDEFDLLLKNHTYGLLSFANILGTTVNKENSMDFIRHRLAIHPDRLGILFEIHFDHLIFNEEYPYALLKSYDLKNAEICFADGCIFRIEAIEQMNANELIIWCIKLRLISKNDSQLVRILTPYRTTEQHENPLSCLGRLLMEMGEYRRVEQFFLEILKDNSILSQPRRLVRAHNGLGANYAHQGDYITALIHYEQALKISLTYLPMDHVDLTSIYKNIGDCSLHEKDYRRALDNYHRAISLIEDNKQASNVFIIDELQTLIKNSKKLLMLTSSNK
ncbi:hypothetical protein I4U23_020336 [Adineta vaga]|nr:hypothetical protein I4U23_020336 [Adineta vaga]